MAARKQPQKGIPKGPYKKRQTTQAMVDAARRREAAKRAQRADR